MRFLLLGKIGGITRWVEDVADDLRLAGHSVKLVPTRNPRLSKSLERLLLSPAIGAPLAHHTVRAMRRFSPDLMLAIGALDQHPRELFLHLFHAKGRPPLVAWTGDTFDEAGARIADLFDIVAYTDSGFLDLHRRFACRSTPHFLPLGASRAHGVDAAGLQQRRPHLAFVAGPTPNRRAVLAATRHTVAIFGPGWQDAAELTQHERHSHRVLAPELARIHAGHMGVLNIRHAAHVINGLNQRHFAPYVQGAPVVSDAQPDIPRCFDPGTEMLVFRDPDELDALQAELLRTPARARAIALAGQRRVLAEHTYSHRLATLAALAGAARAPGG